MVVTQQLKLTALAFAGAVILLPLAGCGPNDAAGESVEAQDLDAWGVNMEKCLEEKGWTIELTPDGGMNTVIPKGQDTSYSADYDACEASFGYDVTPDYSDEQVREIYEQVVVTAECLNEQGHDPGAPPSEQTFVEQVQSGPGGWDPYSGLYPAMMDQEEYYAALESCPRTWH